MPGSRFDQDLGSPQYQRFLQITSTPQKIVITGLHFKTLEVFNSDANNTIYFGDQNVTAGSPPLGNGMPLFPQDFRYFQGAQNAFGVWMVCASGQSAYINIMEYA